MLVRRGIVICKSDFLPAPKIISCCSKYESGVKATKLLLQYAETKLNFVGEQREPVILILDPELLTLGEEPALFSKSKQAFPGFRRSSSLSWSVHKETLKVALFPGIAKRLCFYMVNPDKIPETQRDSKEH